MKCNHDKKYYEILHYKHNHSHFEYPKGKEINRLIVIARHVVTWQSKDLLLKF